MIAIVGYSRLPRAERVTADEAEMVQQVVRAALREAGLAREQIGFYCSGSCDYAMGRPFSFVSAIDGIGPWPPVAESHVEMDGAWALQEAWTHLLMGHIDAAVVYAFGKSSLTDIETVANLQLDPYTLAPLGLGQTELAGLQAAALLASGRAEEADLAAVVARHRGGEVSALLAAPYTAAPLRAHDGPQRTDGAAAVVLAGAELARTLRDQPVWIRGIDHRIALHSPGMRDLSRAACVTASAEALGILRDPPPLAELHTPYSHQELILVEAMGLSGTITPSGGALVDDIPQVSGLIRIGEAAAALYAGAAERAVAHASEGPCLQHNLLCLLERGHG